MKAEKEIIGTIELDSGNIGLIYKDGCRLMCCDMTTGETWDTDTHFDCSEEDGARNAAIASWSDPEWNFTQITDGSDLDVEVLK